MKVAALILAGGKSTRMGKDKGLLKKYGNYWVELIQENLPLPIDNYISVGNHNILEYQNAGFKSLILDKTGLDDISGPIKGLLSGIDLFKEYDKLLVIPCDMINLKTKHFEMLLDQKKSSFFSVNGLNEPLPFCLTKNDLLEIETLDLKNTSVHNILESLEASVVEIPASLSLKNFNTPQDLIQ